MKGNICVVGSLNMDLVIRTAQIPRPGETVSGRNFQVNPGGKGANQAVAAARMGGEVTLVGRIGADDFGERQQQCLNAEAIDLSFLTIDNESSTGVAFIAVDDSGQNSIIVTPEANGRVSVQQVEASQEAIARADVLVCQLEIPLPAVTRAIDIAYARKIPILLNPAPACPLSPELLAKVDYLIPNEFEAGLLSGIPVHDADSARKAALQLQQHGVHVTIVTLGDKGVCAAVGDEYFYEPAPSVDVVDTTAAGDVFVGSFAVALTEGRSLKEAVTFATYAAALSVTKSGAQSSIPTRQEVEGFLQS